MVDVGDLCQFRVACGKTTYVVDVPSNCCQEKLDRVVSLIPYGEQASVNHLWTRYRDVSTSQTRDVRESGDDEYKSSISCMEAAGLWATSYQNYSILHSTEVFTVFTSPLRRSFLRDINRNKTNFPLTWK
eukprot:TRINITY_DN2482_c0_g1_i8.p1 TRINITY_DN2482_c0_g1~~TRINITY_DN2482_c0_g1_i8.p1  ORF type:complete len:130 (+),score=16.26 TRINITY_DN2482_c0_g1_i8:213-602(+)